MKNENTFIDDIVKVLAVAAIVWLFYSLHRLGQTHKNTDFLKHATPYFSTFLFYSCAVYLHSNEWVILLLVFPFTLLFHLLTMLCSASFTK
jgi:uncharacterized membrane protein